MTNQAHRHSLYLSRAVNTSYAFDGATERDCHGKVSLTWNYQTLRPYDADAIAGVEISLTRSERGCALSHYATWMQVAETKAHSGRMGGVAG
eukprot:CAMPEP_0172509928 /NCGR_PEP_ID=MMETSP1066-20121228/224722_1 /TAXON_ID=671091 /ORGANISM="Coscinodiscus wailesii, Strain CCMP2513" /LENGTH=91 /DNA_ID=CAMNT_0013288667 /DNA_START=140 /DNA_END=412 /DNA_ORIENTATION=-